MVEPFIICGNINVEKASDTKKSRLGTFLWKLHPTNLIELPHQHVKINIKSNETENSIIHFFLIRAVKILTTIKNFFWHAFLYGTRMKLLVIFFGCFHKTENTVLIFWYMHFLKKTRHCIECSIVFRIASTHTKIIYTNMHLNIKRYQLEETHDSNFSF